MTEWLNWIDPVLLVALPLSIPVNNNVCEVLYSSCSQGSPLGSFLESYLGLKYHDLASVTWDILKSFFFFFISVLSLIQLFETSWTDYSLSGSSVNGIFQARILVWDATAYFRGFSPPKDQTLVSCVSCIGRQILYQLCHLVCQQFTFYVNKSRQLYFGRVKKVVFY